MAKAKFGWLVWVIDLERLPSSRCLERGTNGEDPGRFMIVGDSVSGTYCGMLLLRGIECRAGGGAPGQTFCCAEVRLDSRRELLECEDPVDMRELAPLRW